MCSENEIVETQVLVNYSHPISFKVDRLDCTNTTGEEPQKKIAKLVVTKEIEESTSLLVENTRIQSKLDLLIEKSYEDLYYRDIIYDYSKLLIQKFICQI